MLKKRFISVAVQIRQGLLENVTNKKEDKIMLHMKGRFKKSLSLLLVFTFILSLTVFADEVNADNWFNYDAESSYIEEEIPEIFALQDRALQAYSALRSAFTVNYDGSVTYPDDFAGAWIENFRLHIATTQSLHRGTSIYDKLLEGFECVVVFTEATFSLNELNQIRTIVFDYLKEEEFPVIEHYVDVKQNRINMSFVELDERSIISSLTRKDMMRVLPEITEITDLFIFSLGEITDTQSAELIGGMYIRRGTATGPRRTIGMCGTFTANGVTHNGIITAGHGLAVSGSNQIIFRDGNEFGRVSILMYHNGAMGDWAAVRLTNSDRLSNRIFGSSSSVTRAITTTLDDLPPGTIVSRFGYMSNYGRAEVIAQNVTVTSPSGHEIRGLTRARITEGTSQGGDSGGPYSLVHNGQWAFVGIHYGDNVAAGGSNVSFTPVVRFRNWFTVRTN